MSLAVLNICWLRLARLARLALLSPPAHEPESSLARNEEEVWTFSAPLASIWLPPGKGEDNMKVLILNSSSHGS